MTNRFFVFVCTLLALGNATLAQDSRGYVPPSPNAQTFQKYGDYPVDYSTGVPGIQVPLYTISLKNYSFPIGASFHASGRTVAMNFSCLGMNWALQAFGMISREVRGIPDENGTNMEQPVSYYASQSSKYDDLRDIEKRVKDSEYDIFSININGISTKFIQTETNGVIFLTYSPYTLTKSGNLFTLIDDKGIKYTFGKGTSNYGFLELNSNAGFISSWFVESIITPTSDTINFLYGSQSSASSTDFQGNYSYTNQASIGDNRTSSPFNEYLINDYASVNTLKHVNLPSHTDFTMGYLKSIHFDNATVDFTYNTQNLLLQRVKVTNNANNEIIKNITFNYYTYLPGTNLTLPNNSSKTIQNIIFRDKTEAEIERYSFDYYKGTTGGNMIDFAKARDYWGYANGRLSDGPNSNYIPARSIWVDDLQGYLTVGCTSCREASLNPKLVGMIKRIHYPTGGNTLFEYEANTYAVNANTFKEGPGIRVKSITSHDNMGSRVKKVYEYGTGVLIWRPNPDTDFMTMTRRWFLDWQSLPLDYPYDYAKYDYRTFSSEPVPEVQAAMRLPIYYNQVTESEVSLVDGKANGKTVYTYSIPSYATPSTSVSAEDNFYIQNFNFNVWSGPLLTNKATYRYDAASNTFKPQSGTTYEFEKYKAVNVTQSSVYKFLEFPTENGDMSTSYIVKTPPPNTGTWPVYYLLDKTISSAVMKPKTETTTEYDNYGGSLSTKVSYYYNNLLHMNPTSIETKKSNQKSVMTYINYPGDYGTVNLLSFPVEKVVTQNDGGAISILSAELTTYKVPGISEEVFKIENDRPVPLTNFKFSNRAIGVLPVGTGASAMSKDPSYKLKIKYSDFNTRYYPGTVSYDNSHVVNYLWGYDHSLPITEVKNAKLSNIFYTGFEEDGNSSAGDAKAGLYSKTGGFTKSLSGLDNGNYILSYWSKSTADWNRITQKVTVSAGAYTISLSGQVDEVRFYPYTAEMTTYSHKKFVGLITALDLNNRSISYTYDNYHRLQYIKDNENNILKQFSYSHINPTFFSEARTVIYTKNDCDPAVYLGSEVPYTIAEGEYSSNVSLADANAKRDAEFALKGQANANASGNCWNYKSPAMSKEYQKQCGTNLYGTWYNYVVPYGKYTSIISSQDAYNKALNDLNTKGQDSANYYGQCWTWEQVFKNSARDVIIKRNNCPFGYKSSNESGTRLIIPYGKYYSTRSLSDAERQANEEIQAAQDYANANETCMPIPQISVQVSNNTNYDMTITFMSSVYGTTVHTAPANQPYGTVSLPEGTYNISMSAPSTTSLNFNFYLGGVKKTGYYVTYNNVQLANISITN